MGESQECPRDSNWMFELDHTLRKGIIPSGITPQAAHDNWTSRPNEARETVALMLRLGPDEALRRLRGEQAKRTTFFGPPTNLVLWFEIQAEAYRRIKAGKEAGMDEGKFKDTLMSAARNFRYREDFASIGLTECFLVLYGLRLAFWVEAGGIDNYLDLSACRNYQGVVTPEKGTVLAIQGQFGEKYRNQKPLHARKHLHNLEQGMTLEERLAAHVVFGSLPLAFVFSNIIGSLTKDGFVPFLRWVHGRPWLSAGRDDDATPPWGAASRGK